MRFFIMFFLISEVVNETFKRALSLKDSLAMNKANGGCLLKCFIALFMMHLFFDFLVFLLANITIITKKTLEEALGGALGILCLNSLHTMGSKYYMMELSGYHNKVYTQDHFLKITFKTDTYRSFHFWVQVLVVLNQVFQIMIVLFKNILVQSFTVITET